MAGLAGQWGVERLFRAVGAINPLAPYSILSNCGRNFLRPFAGLCAVNTAAYFAFGGLAKAEVTVVRPDALLTYTLSNLIPFFGPSRNAVTSASKALFNSDLLPAVVQARAAGQGLMNVTLIFWLLLALRNHFRVK